MARILLLLLFLLWMAGTSDVTPRPPDAIGVDLFLFLGTYVLLIGAMRIWSVRVARRVASVNFGRSLDRFNFTMFAARCFVPAWFAVAIFLLGWGWIVQESLGLGWLQSTRLPAILLGTLPPMLAWMGLWWSQYPAERALREQNVMAQLEEDLPLHDPPRFRAYFLSNFRLQLLFTVVPVLMMIVVRDVINLAVTSHLPGHASIAGRVDGDDDPMEMLGWAVSAGLVFLVAPEVLRRVLRTQPLRPGPLRRRLEALCRRSGVRYRDILFWDTDHNMGNAAVMGIIPPMRYILLSDVLIETMTDDQIEAVFAHEVGHVVHRHMAWFVVFFAVLFTGLWGVERVAEATRWFGANVLVIGSLILSPAAFCLGFGLLSRRFERQADVYAARSLQRSPGTRQGLVPSVDRIAAGASMFTCPAGVIATPNVGLLEGQGFIMGVRTSPDAASTRAGNSSPVASDEQAAKSADDSFPVSDERAAAGRSFVGPYGAMLFSSALHRVAKVNNIPIAKNEWLHGSIAARMQYLRELSTDPALTGRFDRRMVRIYCGLLFALAVSAVWLFSAIR